MVDKQRKSATPHSLRGLFSVLIKSQDLDNSLWIQIVLLVADYVSLAKLLNPSVL